MDRKIIGNLVFIFAVLTASGFFANQNIQAQIIQQDLKKQYEEEQKDLESKAPGQNQNQDPNQEIDIIGDVPPVQDYSTLSQQDADTILESAKALEDENPELAKKLLNLGK